MRPAARFSNLADHTFKDGLKTATFRLSMPLTLCLYSPERAEVGTFSDVQRTALTTLEEPLHDQ